MSQRGFLSFLMAHQEIFHLYCGPVEEARPRSHDDRGVILFSSLSSRRHLLHHATTLIDAGIKKEKRQRTISSRFLDQAVNLFTGLIIKKSAH
jgi:hypothetical protein